MYWGARGAPPYTFDFVVLWFRPRGQYLHLLHKPQADSISPRHFALHVEDIAAWARSLPGRDLAIEETVSIPNADRFFVRDPDGNRIELIQWFKPYDPGHAETMESLHFTNGTSPTRWLADRRPRLGRRRPHPDRRPRPAAGWGRGHRPWRRYLAPGSWTCTSTAATGADSWTARPTPSGRLPGHTPPRDHPVCCDLDRRPARSTADLSGTVPTLKPKGPAARA